MMQAKPISIFNVHGLWSVEGIIEYEPVEKKPANEQIVSEAIEVLRLLVGQKNDLEKGHAYLINITFQPTVLRMKSPITEEWIMFEFAPDVEMNLLCIDPAINNNREHLQLVTYQAEVLWSLENGHWPTDLTRVRSETGVDLTVKDWLQHGLGLNASSVIEEITWVSDGITLRGEMNPPWDSTIHLAGTWKLTWETDQWILLLEGNKSHWRQSLITYQDQVVDATDMRFTVNRVPSDSSPFVGLISGGLPDRLLWTIRDHAFGFDPGGTLFIIELRGSGLSTARVIPEHITIDNHGAHVSLSVGEIPLDQMEDVLVYRYNQTQNNHWEGQLPLMLEGDAINLYRNALENQEPTSERESLKAWVLTPTGSLQLPLESVESEVESPYQPLKGLLRINQMTWQEDESGVASPDITLSTGAMLLVLGHRGLQINLSMSRTDGIWECQELQCKLYSPEFRLENALPVYLPENVEATRAATPPRLPNLKDKNKEDSDRILSLSFLAAPRSATSKAIWQLNMRFTPGGGSPISELQEGDWRNSDLLLPEAADQNSDTAYWYRMPRTDLIPVYPYDRSPAAVDKSLRSGRMLLPFYVDTRNVTSLSIKEQHFTGNLLVPEIHKDSLLFGWFSPALPGLSIHPIPGIPILLEAGIPTDGSALINVYHELPGLYELFALQDTSEPEEEPPAWGEYWWQKLAVRHQLAMTQAQLLCSAQLVFESPKVLFTHHHPVTLHDLLGPIPLEGALSLDLTEQRASLEIRTGGGLMPLIEEDQWLRGAETWFRNSEDRILEPCGSDSATGKLIAGTLAPQKLDNQIILDGFGNVQNSQTEPLKWVQIPIQEVGDTRYFLWTETRFDVRHENHALSLFCQDLPLKQKAHGVLTFSSQDPRLTNPLLRDYGWGTPGKSTIEGLEFQIMRLDQVKATERETGQIVPQEVVVSGVLHLRDQTIEAANPDRQQVRVVWRFSDDQGWQLQHVEGKVIWPFFEDAPDVTGAKEELLSPLPYLEVSLSFDQDHLVFGSEKYPAIWGLNMFGRRWDVPIEIKKIDPDRLVFEVSSTTGEGIHPAGGMGILDRNKNEGTAQLDLRLLIQWSEAETRDVAQLFWTFQMDQNASTLSINEARLLQVDQAVYLASYQTNDDLQIQAGNENISLLFGQPQVVSSFHWLPGISFDANRQWQCYLTLSLPPASSEKIRQLAPSKTDLMLSGASDEFLDFTFMYHTITSGLPTLSLSFTGKLEIQSVFRWSLGGFEAHHELTAFLNEGLLTSEQLSLSDRPGVFFDLEAEKDYVVFPAIVMHQLEPGATGGHHISWTVPQDLRLVRASAIFDLISERGWPPGTREILQENPLVDTLFWEAGEAYWLQLNSTTGASEMESTLWVQKGRQLMGRLEGSSTGPFYRLALPALADIEGSLKDWISLENDRHQAFFITLKDAPISKEEVADQWSQLPYRTKPFSRVEASVYANSTAAPMAVSTLIPYLQPNSDFLWGQLVFDEKFHQSFVWEEAEIELPIRSLSKQERDRRDDGFKRGWSRRIYKDVTALESGTHWLIFSWQAEKHRQNLWIEGQDRIVLEDLAHLKDTQEMMVPLILNEGSQQLMFSMRSYRGAIRLSEITISDDFKLTYAQPKEAKEATEKSHQWVNEAWGKPPGRSRKKSYWRNFRHAPISTREWMKFVWDIPETGSYWLEVKVATTREHQALKIYEGRHVLATLDLPNTGDWDVYRSIWVEIELPQGFKALRFTAWGWLGCRLKYVNLIRGIRQNKNTQPAMLQTILTLNELSKSRGRNLFAAIEKLPIPGSETAEAFENLLGTDGVPKAMTWQCDWSDLRIASVQSGDITKAFQFKVQILTIQSGWGWYELGSKSFVIGLASDQSWEQLLGLESGSEPTENLVLKAVSDWVEEMTSRASNGALVIARSLSTGSHLEDEKWFSISAQAKSVLQPSQEKDISALRPLVRDFHWEPLPLSTVDPLSGGPDYIDGAVYYEPGEWSNPIVPEIPASLNSTLNFQADPMILKLGEAVTLSWDVSLSESVESLLLVDEKTGITYQVSDQSEIQLTPQETTIYALKAFDIEEIEISSARIRVGVRRLLSGTGIGFSWQLSGSPAGFWHQSRDVNDLDNGAFHRWLEWSREVSFWDLTRQGSVEEAGTLLPRTRELPDLPLMKNLLPARVSTISTNGRPGTKQWWRLSFLRAYHASKLMQRTSGFGVSARFPRPVETPEHLWIKPPGFGAHGPEVRVFTTCHVLQGNSNRSFKSFNVYWSDPMYDHQLLAVSQSRTQGPLQLTLDRKVYGPSDVFYPEVKLLSSELGNADQWRVVLKATLMRPQSGRLVKMAEINGLIRANAVFVDTREIALDKAFEEVYSPDNKLFRRYVLEMGLDKRGEGSFLFELLHQDVLLVEARLETPARNFEISLQSQINTEESIWSPPGNATTLFRKIGPEKQTIAHAWVVPPIEVKRYDRFRPDSWSGLFHYQDVMRNPKITLSDLDYEVRSTTPYGEQPVHKTFSR